MLIPELDNSEASFYRPAALWAKICGFRELKTAIQTACCPIYPPYLSRALDPDCLFYWSATLWAKSGGFREL
jgi:hypothetical protein